jgi:isoquinoline 1-oxidoreductase alpha subunit
VSKVNGAVTTIEGLLRDGNHPLQRAWEEIDVPQCGYCQAGQIMTAAALLRPIPSRPTLRSRRPMNGNLCRCGTYLRIRQAVHRAVEIAGARPTQTARAGE